MEINSTEVLLIPEVPKIIDKQQIAVYMPTASYATAGISKFDGTAFIVKDGKVSLRRNTVRAIVDFKMNTDTGEGTLYYDDGTTSSINFPIYSNERFENKDLITEITFAADGTGEFSWQNIDNIWVLAVPLSDTSIDNKSVISVEYKDADGDYVTQLSSVIRSSDGLLLTSEQPFAGRILVVANRFSDYISNLENGTGVGSVQQSPYNDGDSEIINTASGQASFAFGKKCEASGTRAVAIGHTCKAIGNTAMAIGQVTEANGAGSFTGGNGCKSDGAYSIVFGQSNTNIGMSNAVFGVDNHINAQGRGHIIAGSRNVVIDGGNLSQTTDNGSAIFGIENEVTVSYDNINRGNSNIIIGARNKVKSSYSIVGGENNDVKALDSLVVGYNNKVLSTNSGSTSGNNDYLVVVGKDCEIDHDHTQVFGLGLQSKLSSQAVFGKYNEDKENLAFSVGIGVSDTDRYNVIEAYYNRAVSLNGGIATGAKATAIGTRSEATGNSSFAGGQLSEATGDIGFAFGYQSKATAYCTLAQGYHAEANGAQAVAMGTIVIANGARSFAGGWKTTITGENSFGWGESLEVLSANGAAYGKSNKIDTTANRSFASGYNNTITNVESFAAGNSNTVSGNAAFAAGNSNTMASQYGFTAGAFNTTGGQNAGITLGYGLQNPYGETGSVVVGRYNVRATTNAFVVGNGKSNTERATAFAVTWDGRAKVATAPTEDDDVVRLADVKANYVQKHISNDNGVRVYASLNDETTSILLSANPTSSLVPRYSLDGRLRTFAAVDALDCVNLTDLTNAKTELEEKISNSSSGGKLYKHEYYIYLNGTDENGENYANDMTYLCISFIIPKATALASGSFDIAGNSVLKPFVGIMGNCVSAQKLAYGAGVFEDVLIAGYYTLTAYSVGKDAADYLMATNIRIVASVEEV